MFHYKKQTCLGRNKKVPEEWTRKVWHLPQPLNHKLCPIWLNAAQKTVHLIDECTAGMSLRRFIHLCALNLETCSKDRHFLYNHGWCSHCRKCILLELYTTLKPKSCAALLFHAPLCISITKHAIGKQACASPQCVIIHVSKYVITALNVIYSLLSQGTGYFY